MAVAVFDWAQFQQLFPALVAGGVTEPVASAVFLTAGYLLDNTDCSRVQDIAARLVYLDYATAHLLSIGGYPLPPGGAVPTPSGLVGRITGATEGTVSVQSAWGASVSDSEAFWLQSQYGAIFWQMTRWLRTARYVAPPPRNFSPFPFGGYPGPLGPGWR